MVNAGGRILACTCSLLSRILLKLLVSTDLEIVDAKCLFKTKSSATNNKNNIKYGSHGR